MLLVAAFARPFFSGESALATVGTGPTEVVILLDQSYSMAAGERWRLAQAAVSEAVSGIGPLGNVLPIHLPKERLIP